MLSFYVVPLFVLYSVQTSFHWMIMYWTWSCSAVSSYVSRICFHLYRVQRLRLYEKRIKIIKIYLDFGRHESKLIYLYSLLCFYSNKQWKWNKENLESYLQVILPKQILRETWSWEKLVPERNLVLRETYSWLPTLYSLLEWWCNFWKIYLWDDWVGGLVSLLHKVT